MAHIALPENIKKIQTVEYKSTFRLESNAVLNQLNQAMGDGEKMARFSGALWQWVMVVLVIALLEGASSVSICDIDSAQLNYCRPAVSGKSSTPPSKKCCGVVRQANLPCLCNYKAVLPSFGIDPAQAMALPKKCGVETPPECVA